VHDDKRLQSQSLFCTAKNTKSVKENVWQQDPAQRFNIHPGAKMESDKSKENTKSQDFGNNLGRWLKRTLFGAPSSISPLPSDLTERAEPILRHFLSNKVQLRRRSYHLENLTIELLRDVLGDKNQHCPRKGEWLRNWDGRPNIPKDVIALRNRAYTAIQERLRDLQIEENARRESESKQKQLQAEQEAILLLDKHATRVDKFLALAYRKVATPDEYGDENPKALAGELIRFMSKLADIEPSIKQLDKKDAFFSWLQDTITGEREFHADLFPLEYAIGKELRARFSNYYQKRKERAAACNDADFTGMSGREFELYLADLLRKAGVIDVATTPISGDQGGDLLFTWNRRRYVIQAKRYTASVGNKAVQEAHAAKGYYGCDEAWVLTNSQFTTSAKSLAKELGVTLIDGDVLAHTDNPLAQFL
jgi:hypothetical protein